MLFLQNKVLALRQLMGKMQNIFYPGGNYNQVN